MDEEEKKVERPQEWHSVYKAPPEPEAPVEEEPETEAPVEETLFSSEGEQPFNDDEVEKFEVEEPEYPLDTPDEQIIYSSGGEQPFDEDKIVYVPVGPEANIVPVVSNAVIANVEPKIVDALPESHDEHVETVNNWIVKSFSLMVGALIAIIIAIIVYNTVLAPYEIKPNYAPETAPYERTPGEITRDSLDPRTHFPRKPEVIRKERYEQTWNEMNVFERLWWWLNDYQKNR